MKWSKLCHLIFRINKILPACGPRPRHRRLLATAPCSITASVRHSQAWSQDPPRETTILFHDQARRSIKSRTHQACQMVTLIWLTRMSTTRMLLLVCPADLTQLPNILHNRNHNSSSSTMGFHRCRSSSNRTNDGARCHHSPRIPTDCNLNLSLRRNDTQHPHLGNPKRLSSETIISSPNNPNPWARNPAASTLPSTSAVLFWLNTGAWVPLPPKHQKPSPQSPPPPTYLSTNAPSPSTLAVYSIPLRRTTILDPIPNASSLNRNAHNPSPP